MKTRLILENLAVATALVGMFSSCMKNDSGIEVENITKGDKWGIRIGSSPEEVFSRLQQLGNDKGFTNVAVVYRKPYTRLEDVRHLLSYYDCVNLHNNRTAYVERTTIAFSGEMVEAIHVGGALPAETDRWPEDVPSEIAVAKSDSVEMLYEKLLAISKLPDYRDYSIVLPDKTLSKPFDPDMENYGEWAFTFFEDTQEISKTARSAVRLYFDRGKLDKIRHEYREMEVVIN